MNSPKLMRFVLLATIFLFVVLTLGLLTNQGLAISQEPPLRFFTRLDYDEFWEPIAENDSFEATTPFHPQCSIVIHPTCSVEDVRSMVDFEVKELSILPHDMKFVGATGGPDYIALVYGYGPKTSDALGLTVWATDHPSAMGAVRVAQGTVVDQVSINSNPGEYYEGSFYQADDGSVAWQPDYPSATLRWDEGGSSYLLTYAGRDLDHMITQAEMIAIAESLTSDPVDQ